MILYKQIKKNRKKYFFHLNIKFKIFYVNKSLLIQIIRDKDYFCKLYR